VSHCGAEFERRGNGTTLGGCFLAAEEELFSSAKRSAERCQLPRCHLCILNNLAISWWSLIADSRGRIASFGLHATYRGGAEQGVHMLLNGRPLEPGVLPQPMGNRDRFDAGGVPPRRLVAVPVNLAMVGAAERHRELVADPASQGPGLHESQVMGVRR
jgi:hypothetical protein